MKSIHDYQSAYSQLSLDLSGLVSHVLSKIQPHDVSWITAPTEAILNAEVSRLKELSTKVGIKNLPLFGIPIAVKDNIDVKGLPTTAACPDFRYEAKEDAFVIHRLKMAGAIIVGKTNMDQFATGLNGTRSPYGAVPNPFNKNFISGGSSSGSASVVSRYIVPIALGTDTAGSGRVPAGFCNIVGLKPSLGLISKRGLVPACKSVDTISIFGLNIADCQLVAKVAYGYDEDDPLSIETPTDLWQVQPKSQKLAIPNEYEALVAPEIYASTQEDFDTLGKGGFELVPTDLSPLTEIARLLYEGAFLSERYQSFGHLVDSRKLEVLPVIKKILSKSHAYSAVDLFNAQELRDSVKRVAQKIFRTCEAIVVPTITHHFEIDELVADPIAKNSALGVFTNFVNLLDLSAIAIPASFAKNGLPTGLTLIGPKFHDAKLMVLAQEIMAKVSAWSGVEPCAQANPPLVSEDDPNETNVVVVGAHLSGMPLNHQLVERNARLVLKTRTSKRYSLYALTNTTPIKPGLVRKGEHGIEVEVWRLSKAHFGSFVSLIPSPLCIGRVELEDGQWAQGFLCEPWALEGMPEISSFGGFKAYIKSLG